MPRFKKVTKQYLESTYNAIGLMYDEDLPVVAHNNPGMKEILDYCKSQGCKNPEMCDMDEGYIVYGDKNTDDRYVFIY